MFPAHLSEASTEGAMHGGRVLLGSGLARKEYATTNTLGQNVVVFATEGAHSHAAVAAICHLIRAPPGAGHLGFQELGVRLGSLHVVCGFSKVFESSKSQFLTCRPNPIALFQKTNSGAIRI